MFQVIVFLHKGAKTEVILVYDFNREYLHGDAKCLGNFAWGFQIPCSVGDTINTERVPKSLGGLSWGARFPMTLAMVSWRRLTKTQAWVTVRTEVSPSFSVGDLVFPFILPIMK